MPQWLAKLKRGLAKQDFAIQQQLRPAEIDLSGLPPALATRLPIWWPDVM